MRTEVLANTSNSTGLTQAVQGASLHPSAMKIAVDAERYIAFCESCISTIEGYLRGALQQSDNGPLVWRYRDGWGKECEVSVSEKKLKVTGSERLYNFLFYRAGSDAPAITASVHDGPLATGPKDDGGPSVWILVSVFDGRVACATCTSRYRSLPNTRCRSGMKKGFVSTSWSGTGVGRVPLRAVSFVLSMKI